jgi:uncharacterized protein
MPQSHRFTKKQASRLMAFLSAPERPDGTMGYCELSGFLFAVACSPDPIMPSEWLPLVFDEQGGGYKDQKEAQEVMTDLMALYNKINDGVLKKKPALPPGCEPRPEGIDNFERDAPLCRWSRGFGDGHAWLEDVWEEFIPPELDQEAGLALLLLTFFADRKLAQSYRKELGRASTSMKDLAAEVLESFPLAMKSCVAIGRGV